MPRFQEHFVVEESDCTVVTNYEPAIKKAMTQLVQDRAILKFFVKNNPVWQNSFVPMHTKDPAPIIELMEESAEICDVGPMAAVAGALADRMQMVMLENKHVQVAVVEDGGEIAINSAEDIVIALYVLSNSLKAKLGFKFAGGSTAVGLGTSSGQFGHSISLGEADTATIFAKNAALADAAATKICNAVKGEDHEKSILKGLDLADKIDGLYGVFITRGKFIGKKGKIPDLVTIQDGEQFILHEKFKFV